MRSAPGRRMPGASARSLSAIFSSLGASFSWLAAAHCRRSPASCQTAHPPALLRPGRVHHDPALQHDDLTVTPSGLASGAGREAVVGILWGSCSARALLTSSESLLFLHLRR
jgi:hypothetical protein